MKREDIKKGETIVNQLAEKTTLKLFRVGCDKTNFAILQDLPKTAREIEKKVGLSAMPTNRRLKELMEVGLVHREKRGDKIKQTEIASYFIQYIITLKKQVIKNMADLIST